ncbi:von Willebrand factor type A [Oscillochloris trichoides DG-6]|uniref:von Willebrand factor type A n=1 Tax=Oscillochloris trichoides DG-6 TaxID=765420 RepID=E1IHC7_9CHLR|nr:VWA domain-containing protein [Oscillochloris trichoides]EFO79380.1 von Willebrand factor type A [Oscillochloris trichoides DG-6]
MAPGIQLRSTLSRSLLPDITEEQLVYVLLEVSAHGVPTNISKLPLNLCLVIDRSSSMRGERLQQVKDAANRIVDMLTDDDYLSLVTFNDRAEVVIPAQRPQHRPDLKRMISGIEAAGGTEMATGMALALQETQRPLMGRGVSRILLLTDGRTYGDEGRCVEIARRAQGRGVGLTALGIGGEWNEDLLETMSARENSRTQYITSAAEITQIFTDEVKRMHSVFAQDLQLRAEVRPGGMLRSLDRVRPFIATVPIVEEKDLLWTSSLGDWPGTDPQAFLLEVVVPPLPAGDHPLVRLTLRYSLPGANLMNQEGNLVLRIGVRPSANISYEVDATVRHWLERLVAYRLQAGAWQDVEAGRIEEATRRLQMAGTRLFEAGQIDLARTVQEEATRLSRSGQTSAEGRKRIKYGTRGLMQGEGMQEREV